MNEEDMPRAEIRTSSGNKWVFTTRLLGTSYVLDCQIEDPLRRYLLGFTVHRNVPIKQLADIAEAIERASGIDPIINKTGEERL